MARKKQRCGNCYFFRDVSPPFIEGHCHRYAPSPYSFYRYYLGELIRDCALSLREISKIEVEQSEDDDVTTEATEAVDYNAFPLMEAAEWCGEWKPKRTRRK